VEHLWWGMQDEMTKQNLITPPIAGVDIQLSVNPTTMTEQKEEVKRRPLTWNDLSKVTWASSMG
jgi:hypothetical protein